MAQIVWHTTAIQQLQEIYDYYYQHMSSVVADNLIDDLLEAPDQLIRFPNSGAIEPMLQDMPVVFRYVLVRRTYKIMYYVQDDTCHLAAIWDTRNNPELLPS